MLNPLLPEAVPLRCRHTRIQPDLVTVVVETTGPKAACSICAGPSGRVHRGYTRTLGDLPWQERVVRWSFVARKVFCYRAACARQIFTELLPEVTAPYARKTGRLEQALGPAGDYTQTAGVGCGRIHALPPSQRGRT